MKDMRQANEKNDPLTRSVGLWKNMKNSFDVGPNANKNQDTEHKLGHNALIIDFLYPGHLILSPQAGQKSSGNFPHGFPWNLHQRTHVITDRVYPRSTQSQKQIDHIPVHISNEHTAKPR